MERCFKLAANVDLHVASADGTDERVVDGVTHGLVGAGEIVKFEGRHFGLQLSHTTRIDGWRPYSYFREVMVDGSFTRFEHEHHFAMMDDGTRMRDEIRFAAPYGLMGRMAEKMLLKKHLISILKRRNAVLKRVAESEEWRNYLDESAPVPKAARPPAEGFARGWDKSALLRG